MAETFPAGAALAAPNSERDWQPLILGSVVAIAIADCVTPRFAMPILYFLPLVGYGWLVSGRGAWRLALLLCGLTFVGYFVKYTILPVADGRPQYWNVRLLNRCFLAAGIGLLGKVLEMLQEWKLEWHAPDLPADFVREEDDLNGTLALCAAVVLLIAVAVGDFVSGVNINLSVLYALPLILCVWLRKPIVLWAVFGVIVVLTPIGAILGHESGAVPTDIALVAAHRGLLVLVLFVVTVLLVSWTNSSSRDLSRR